MKQIPGFEGPRPIRLKERRSGQELFRVCFGGGDPETAPDAEVSEELTGDSSWMVMLPSDGPFQGKVVSQIRIYYSQVLLGCSPVRVASIGGVSTHPDFRGKGLAGCILQTCVQELTAKGAHLMLISGERGLYTRTGNVQAMRFNTFKLQAGQVKKPQWMPAVTVRQFAKRDVPILAKLHQAEAVRFRRQMQDFDDDFAPGDSWVVELDQVPLAYFLRMPWYSEPGKLEVVEYAGSRLALGAGLCHMLTGINDPAHAVDFQELTIAVPWQDADLMQILDWIGGQSAPEPLSNHTMRLVNFPALRNVLGAYIAARLPRCLRRGLRFEQFGALLVDPADGEAGDGRCAVVWHHHRLELSTAQMTRLVFGACDMPGEGDRGDLAPPGPLGEIIDLLFPLPSFQPGLNLR
jgi:GNAT superfamily N-acetyltransferase